MRQNKEEKQKDTVEQNQSEKPKIGYREVFTQKQYVKVIFANLISRFGDSIDAIAFTWLVYAITGKASWSAIIFALNMLPSVVVQPFAGALVEGMNKKRVMIWSDVARGVCVSLLAVSYVSGSTNVIMLVVFTLIISTVEAFCMPASTAILPMVLERDYYEFGTSLNSTASIVLQLLGTGAAGFIIAQFGIGAAIFIDGATFFGSALVTATVKCEEKSHERSEVDVTGYFRLLGEGIHYVKDQKVIRNFCLLAFLCNALLAPVNALQTPLIVEVLQQGSELLSFFGIASLAGTGIASFVYPYISRKISPTTCILLQGCLMGVNLGLMVAGGFWVENTLFVYSMTCVASFGIGASASILMSAMSVQFMKCVKQDYLARVGAIFNAGACAASPVMSGVIGGIAAWFSVKSLFIGFGVLCVILFLSAAVCHIQLEETEGMEGTIDGEPEYSK